MALLDFLPLLQETAATIRARIDADANSGIDVDDPRWVDTREGTFFFDVTQPLVLEFARLYDAISVDMPAAAFPLFAWGEYLDAHAEVFNLERKEAVAATATAHFVGDPGTLVGSGTVVSAELAGLETDESVEFVTTESGTTGTALTAPAGLAPTPSTTGGTLASDTYNYSVTAANTFGETLASSSVAAVVVGPTGSVSLDWDEVAGATRYRLYRATTGAAGRVYDGVGSTFVDAGAVVPGVAPPEENLTSGVALGVEALEPGSEANVAANAIIVLETPNLGIDEVYNPDPATGGTDTELDEALRERILLEYGGQGAGNRNDYRRWALAYSGVGRVSVNPAWRGAGTVQVVVMTGEGDPVATSVVTGLQAQLDPPPVGQGAGIAPVGAVVTVQTPAVISIDVAATITFEAGYSLDGGGGTTAVRATLIAALEQYINGLDVGEDVVYEHVKASFFQVEGVYNISSVLVEGASGTVPIESDPPQTAQLGTATLS